MPRVTRRPLAETDILEIWDYIAEDSPATSIGGGAKNTGLGVGVTLGVTPKVESAEIQ